MDKAFAGADTVIIFSTGSAIKMVQAAVEKGAAVVLGTTALPPEEKAAIAELGKQGRIVFASNMSVGVNLLCKLAAEAAAILGSDYDVEIVEMHHNQKKDAPSGTAVTLAETVGKVLGLDYEKDTRHGRVGMVGARTKKEIGSSMRAREKWLPSIPRITAGSVTWSFRLRGRRRASTFRPIQTARTRGIIPTDTNPNKCRMRRENSTPSVFTALRLT